MFWLLLRKDRIILAKNNLLSLQCMAQEATFFTNRCCIVSFYVSLSPYNTHTLILLLIVSLFVMAILFSIIELAFDPIKSLTKCPSVGFYKIMLLLWLEN